MSSSQAVAAEPRRGRSGAIRVMSVTLATSAALGVLAYFRFMSSDRYLVRAAVEMRSRGAALSPA